MTRKEYSIHWLTRIDDSLAPINIDESDTITVNGAYTLSKCVWLSLCTHWLNLINFWLRSEVTVFNQVGDLQTCKYETSLKSWDLRVPRNATPPPPRNKALSRDYLPLSSLNKALLGPYFFGELAFGVPLDSHDKITTQFYTLPCI